MTSSGGPGMQSPPSEDYPAQTLFDRLRGLELPAGEYAIFGSGPLAIRGLIDRAGDLDVLVSDLAWELVRNLGTIVTYGNDETVDLGNGLTFGRSWAYGEFDIDQLIHDAEMIDGLPFVTIDAVLEFKRIASRSKDLEHLALMESAGLT